MITAFRSTRKKIGRPPNARFWSVCKPTVYAGVSAQAASVRFLSKFLFHFFSVRFLSKFFFRIFACLNQFQDLGQHLVPIRFFADGFGILKNVHAELELGELLVLINFLARVRELHVAEGADYVSGGAPGAFLLYVRAGGREDPQALGVRVTCGER